MSARPFRDFTDAFDLAHYAPVPEDWLVAVSDVVDSTTAIARGRYKDVNMAGAATIASVLNACGRDDLPFAFGGDGGIVLLPPECAEPAKAALSGARKLCADITGLELRCSLIPASVIRAKGGELLVAFHDLGGGRLLAMLAGGGIAIAEDLCKSPGGAAYAREAAGECDLSGLSCRFNPLKPERGIVLSLLVRVREDGALPALYGDLYRRVATMVEAAHPFRAAPSSSSFSPAGWLLEATLLGRKGRLKRAARILVEEIAYLISRKMGVRIAGFDARAYEASLTRHCDHCKYADSLRMVIDCSAAEADTITALLHREWQMGRIEYGTHRAQAALMTCFVKSLEEAGHIHFIDGADGGYALAARDMKQRMEQA